MPDTTPAIAATDTGNRSVIVYTIIMLAVFAMLVPQEYSFMCDEKIWHTVATQWRNGIAPYTGLLENKNPGIFYIHLLLTYLGNQPYLGRVIAAILQTGAALLAFDMTRHLIGKTQRLWTFAAFIVLVSLPNTEPYNVGATESFMLSFTMLGFWAYVRGIRANYRYAALCAGAAVGMAVVFKQIAIVSLAAMMLWPFFEKKPKAAFFDSAMILVSAVCVNFLVLIPLFLSGTTFTQYFATAWLSLFKIGRFATGAHVASFDISLFGEWLAPLALFLYVCGRKKETRPYAMWLVFDFMGSIASGDYFAHQFKQLIPAMAVCAGLSLSEVFSSMPERVRRAAPSVALGLFLVLMMANRLFVHTF